MHERYAVLKITAPYCTETLQTASVDPAVGLGDVGLLVDGSMQRSSSRASLK